MSLSIAKFDRFADLEDYVMDCLVSVTDLKVFECSIEFLHLATQTNLEDPIWNKEYGILHDFQGLQRSPLQDLLEGCPVHSSCCPYPHAKLLMSCSLQWVQYHGRNCQIGSVAPRLGIVSRGCINLAEFALQESSSQASCSHNPLPGNWPRSACLRQHPPAQEC